MESVDNLPNKRARDASGGHVRAHPIPAVQGEHQRVGAVGRPPPKQLADRRLAAVAAR